MSETFTIEEIQVEEWQISIFCKEDDNPQWINFPRKCDYPRTSSQCGDLDPSYVKDGHFGQIKPNMDRVISHVGGLMAFSSYWYADNGINGRLSAIWSISMIKKIRAFPEEEKKMGKEYVKLPSPHNESDSIFLCPLSDLSLRWRTAGQEKNWLTKAEAEQLLSRADLKTGKSPISSTPIRVWGDVDKAISLLRGKALFHDYSVDSGVQDIDIWL